MPIVNTQAVFRIRLHGAPLSASKSDAQRGCAGSVDGPTRPLGVGNCNVAALGGSFEQIAERLQALPRAHVEWDGSFVVRSDDSQQQIDGMIYDALGQVQHIELLGNARRQLWDSVLSCVFSPSASPDSSPGTSPNSTSDTSNSMPSAMAIAMANVWVHDLADGSICRLATFEKRLFDHQG